MIAKYSGKCKVTGQEIVAGETEIVKLGGVWQVAPAAAPAVNAQGQAQYEILGMDKSGRWQPANYDQAFDAWYMIQMHIYGHDYHPSGYDFMFAKAGTEWVSHMGLQVRVNFQA